MQEMRLRKWIFLLVFSFLCFIKKCAAIERIFQHRFALESAQTTALNESTSRSISNNQQVRYGGSMVSPVRWNTHTIISNFGMEKGASVELEIHAVSFLPSSSSSQQQQQQQQQPPISPVPVVFTLYNYDQWRVYSVLQLRDMPLQDPSVLCHYPSYMRHSVLEIKDKHREKIQFTIDQASQYTLQVQVCGPASNVLVKGSVKMVNLDPNYRLAQHLGVEKLGLIPLYKVLIVIYCVLTMLWILECYLRRRSVPVRSLPKAHDVLLVGESHGVSVGLF